MQTLDTILQVPTEDSVVATIVELVGSGYRIPGARMVISSEGTHAGTISGGCLEKDVARGAFAYVENGSCLVLYDTRADEFRPNGQYGTGCEGLVYLLLEPSASSALADIGDARSSRTPLVVATVFRSPNQNAHVGARTVSTSHREPPKPSPSQIEPVMSAAVRNALDTCTSEILRISDGREQWSVLVEFIAPRPRLIIIGHGEDARALANLCDVLGWDVVLGSRDPLRLTDLICETVVVTDAIDHLEIDAFTDVVLMTHDFEFDRDILPALLESKPSYLGILGPKKRTASMLSELISNGRAIDLDVPLHSPVGLDLGSDEPSHVALAVAAEIVVALNERAGGMLRTSSRGVQKKVPVRTIDLNGSV